MEKRFSKPNHDVPATGREWVCDDFHRTKYGGRENGREGERNLERGGSQKRDK